MTPRFLTVLNGLSKSKSHLKEKVALVFNTSYTLPRLPGLAEFSNYAELCTFEHAWSTAEEGSGMAGGRGGHGGGGRRRA